MTGPSAAPGALGLGPRAEHVEKLDRDLLAERYGTCRCGGPCTVALRRRGDFGVGETVTVRVCVDCGRTAGLIEQEDPNE